MRRLQGRKKKGTKRRTLVKNLDMYFSRYIRWSHADSDGNVKCITCDAVKHVKEMQCGHFMSRRYYSTRWLSNTKLSNCHPQCYGCNIGSQGKQYKHSQYIDRTYGEGTAQRIADRAELSRKYTNEELITLSNYYKKKVDELCTKHC